MKLRNSRLLTSVCLAPLAVSAMSGVASAQDAAADEEGDIIVVTGFRASLEQAADIKRQSIGVVDAITAEDIGKFPDANLAESLQRIPGVSIDRANNEGNQVTVRGFGPSFNLVTLNGRQMPNSSSIASDGVSRSFNFRELGSEGVKAIEVYKTGQADIYSGGLGAAINVLTPRPLDQVGFRAAATVKGLWDVDSEVGSSITPELSGLVSSTFADDTLGVLLQASYSERNSRRKRIGTSGNWVRNRGPRANQDLSAIDTNNNPSQTFFTPFTIDNDLWDTQRERLNGQAVIQARPFDGLTLTADYTMSRFEQNTEMNRMSFWFDTPDTGRADANGTLVELTSVDDELNFWAWDYYERVEGDSFGLNLEWEVTDSLTLEFDAHDSTSKSNPNGETAETLGNLKNPNAPPPDSVDVTISGVFTDGLPIASFDDSRLPSGDAYLKSNIVSDLFQKRGFSMDNNIKQARFAGRWENLDGGGIAGINFGADYTKYDVYTEEIQTFSFVEVPLDNLDLTFVDSFQEGSFPFIPQYSVHDFIDIVEAEGDFFINAPRINGVTEETMSFFASIDIDTEFNGMPFRANAGIRYEDTDVEAFSLEEGIVGFNYRNVAGLQTIFDGVVAPQTLESGYKQFLPNVSMVLEPFNDFVVRASYSKTIARSSIGALFPGQSVSGRPGGPFTASQGNPGLLPYESDNFDLSLEWYYDPGSYVSLGAFKKFVDNFIGSVITQGPVLNAAGDPITDPSVNPRPPCPVGTEPPNPACFSQPGDPVVIFDISTTGNLRSASVQGLEGTLQHMFGDTGFGLVLNGTLVDGDIDYDVFDFSQVFALTGLGHSANAVAFYEKGPLQARVSYNWRDKFLLGIRGNGEPVFTESYGQVDVNASYDVNDRFTVFVEGINVTDEATRRHGRFPEQIIDYETFGPRYSFGVRAKF